MVLFGGEPGPCGIRPRRLSDLSYGRTVTVHAARGNTDSVLAVAVVVVITLVIVVVVLVAARAARHS
jgi:hypothetical protein